MIIVASSNGNVGMAKAMAVLRSGGRAIDAVEAGIREVEANPDDYTVGFNGFPNILGEAELDASIMNGRTLESGAVAAMRGYQHPISVARKVMERLPHVLLVGDGATRFSAEMGFPTQQTLLTPEMEDHWRKRLERELPAEVADTIENRDDLWRWVQFTTDPERAWSTVNFIAQDQYGDICSGVSTSGWAWKYPGRVGDSPIIGAGNYADNRYGAAGCTGMGEMAIRASTAHSLVFYMKMGLSVREAGQRAMEDLRDLGGRFISGMNLVALDKNGDHAGFTTTPGKTYVVQSAEMESYAELPRTVVDIPPRWDHPTS